MNNFCDADGGMLRIFICLNIYKNNPFVQAKQLVGDHQDSKCFLVTLSAVTEFIYDTKYHPLLRDD